MAGPKISSGKNSGFSLKYNFDHEANPYNKRSIVYGSSKHKESKPAQNTTGSKFGNSVSNQNISKT